MTLWCLSGFVMMYQEFPALSNEQRLAGLGSLDLRDCCDLSALDVHDQIAVPGFRVEMLLGDPVLRLARGVNQRGTTNLVSTFNLRTGEPAAELSENQVIDVAARYGRGNQIQGSPRLLGVIDIDQWTVQTASRNQPVYHLAYDDDRSTEVYISGASGEVFQTTNRRTRLLAWLGAIPHWLYPTQLRQHGTLWADIVIWTSMAGTFLAATGLYVGISRLRWRREESHRASPYYGLWYWHHITGLVFGVLALTWVFSGLMTMNPWGALAGGPVSDYRSTLVGSANWGELKRFLTAVTTQTTNEEYAQLQPAVFNNQLYVNAGKVNGGSVRLDVNAVPTIVQLEHVEELISRLNVSTKDFQLMTSEDSYYYGRKTEIPLPVFRAILDDAEQTRVYINPETGSVSLLSASGRLSRWIRTGLHGLDFPVLRVRPLWDIVVILLLAGVTLLCALGTWMGCKRIKYDVQHLAALLRKRFSPPG